MFEKIKKLFNHRHRWKPVVGFISLDADHYSIITINYKCWCGDGYARTERLTMSYDYIRVPYDVFSTDGIER